MEGKDSTKLQMQPPESVQEKRPVLKSRPSPEVAGAKIAATKRIKKDLPADSPWLTVMSSLKSLKSLDTKDLKLPPSAVEDGEDSTKPQKQEPESVQEKRSIFKSQPPPEVAGAKIAATKRVKKDLPADSPWLTIRSSLKSLDSKDLKLPPSAVEDGEDSTKPQKQEPEWVQKKKEILKSQPLSSQREATTVDGKDSTQLQIQEAVPVQKIKKNLKSQSSPLPLPPEATSVDAEDSTEPQKQEVDSVQEKRAVFHSQSPPEVTVTKGKDSTKPEMQESELVQEKRAVFESQLPEASVTVTEGGESTKPQKQELESGQEKKTVFKTQPPPKATLKEESASTKTQKQEPQSVQEKRPVLKSQPPPPPEVAGAKIAATKRIKKDLPADSPWLTIRSSLKSLKSLDSKDLKLPPSAVEDGEDSTKTQKQAPESVQEKRSIFESQPPPEVAGAKIAATKRVKKDLPADSPWLTIRSSLKSLKSLDSKDLKLPPSAVEDGEDSTKTQKQEPESVQEKRSIFESQPPPPPEVAGAKITATKRVKKDLPADSPWLTVMSSLKSLKSLDTKDLKLPPSAVEDGEDSTKPQKQEPESVQEKRSIFESQPPPPEVAGTKAAITKRVKKDLPADSPWLTIRSSLKSLKSLDSKDLKLALPMPASENEDGSCDHSANKINKPLEPPGLRPLYSKLPDTVGNPVYTKKKTTTTGSSLSPMSDRGSVSSQKSVQSKKCDGHNESLRYVSASEDRSHTTDSVPLTESDARSKSRSWTALSSPVPEYTSGRLTLKKVAPPNENKTSAHKSILLLSSTAINGSQRPTASNYPDDKTMRRRGSLPSTLYASASTSLGNSEKMREKKLKTDRDDKATSRRGSLASPLDAMDSTSLTNVGEPNENKWRALKSIRHKDDKDDGVVKQEEIIDASEENSLSTKGDLKKIESPNEKNWNVPKIDEAAKSDSSQQLRPVTPPIEDKGTVTDNQATQLDTNGLLGANKKILMLISSTSGRVDQKTAQDRALTILKGMQVSPEQLDGAIPANRERRNELFVISGIRAHYPQFFLIDANNEIKYFADWEAFETMHDMGSLLELMNLDVTLTAPSSVEKQNDTDAIVADDSSHVDRKIQIQKDGEMTTNEHEEENTDSIERQDEIQLPGEDEVLVSISVHTDEYDTEDDIVHNSEAEKVDDKIQVGNESALKVEEEKASLSEVEDIEEGGTTLAVDPEVEKISAKNYKEDKSNLGVDLVGKEGGIEDNKEDIASSMVKSKGGDSSTAVESEEDTTSPMVDSKNEEGEAEDTKKDLESPTIDFEEGHSAQSVESEEGTSSPTIDSKDEEDEVENTKDYASNPTVEFNEEDTKEETSSFTVDSKDKEDKDEEEDAKQSAASPTVESKEREDDEEDAQVDAASPTLESKVKDTKEGAMTLVVDCKEGDSAPAVDSEEDTTSPVVDSKARDTEEDAASPTVDSEQCDSPVAVDPEKDARSSAVNSEEDNFVTAVDSKEDTMSPSCNPEEDDSAPAVDFKDDTTSPAVESEEVTTSPVVDSK